MLTGKCSPDVQDPGSRALVYVVQCANLPVRPQHPIMLAGMK